MRVREFKYSILEDTPSDDPIGSGSGRRFPTRHQSPSKTLSPLAESKSSATIEATEVDQAEFMVNLNEKTLDEIGVFWQHMLKTQGNIFSETQPGLNDRQGSDQNTLGSNPLWSKLKYWDRQKETLYHEFSGLNKITEKYDRFDGQNTSLDLFEPRKSVFSSNFGETLYNRTSVVREFSFPKHPSSSPKSVSILIKNHFSDLN
jgi:hypothetical protein